MTQNEADALVLGADGGAPSRLCVMVGPTRTATTSLFRYFSRHPQVVASNRKETNYFLKEVVDAAPVLESTFEDCFDLSTGGDVLFEASPLYFMLGRRVARAVHAFDPKAHIVITLRDPVKRFFSTRTMINNKRNVGMGIDHKYGAREFFDLCHGYDPAQFVDFRDVNAMTLAEGLYGRLVNEWLSVFPQNQVHFVLYDWMLKPEGASKVRQTVFDALGLDDRFPSDENLFHENKARDVRHKGLHAFAYKINKRFEKTLNSQKPLRDLIRNMYYAVNEADRDREDEQTRSRVRTYYENDLRELDRALTQCGFHERPDWLQLSQKQ